MWKRKTFINWNSWSQRIPRIQNYACCLTGSEKSQDLLKGQVEAGYLKFFEHHFDQDLSIFLWVSWRLSHQDGTILWSHLQLVDEAMMPHFVHVVPVLDDAIDDRSREVEDALFGGDLISDVNIFLIHADHLSRLFGPADDGWEAGFGCVIPSDTHFDKARSAIDDKSRILVHVSQII